MNQQTISISAADLNTVVRYQQAEITNLRLVLANTRRQLVETQVALAAVKKGDANAVEGGGQTKEGVADHQDKHG